jgi:spermidine/putrescine transport system permease protein
VIDTVPGDGDTVARMTVPAPGRANVRMRRRRFGADTRRAAILLSLPSGGLLLFFVVPVVLVAMHSVGALTLLPSDRFLTLERWRDFFGSIYLGTFVKSLRISLTVSILCVALAYPTAYFLAVVAGRRRYNLLLLTLAPFLTGFLLRILAWRVLLNPQGVITSALREFGPLAADDSIPWLFNSQFAVHLVLAYVWVPFVCLPIFVVLEGLDAHQLEAASDLGAGRWRAFWLITFPQSLPGVIAGFLFVFIPTIGEYITPLLVGGPNSFMFGNAIQGAYLQGFDWQFGSVLGVFLIAVVGVITAVFGRYLSVGTVAE